MRYITKTKSSRLRGNNWFLCIFISSFNVYIWSLTKRFWFGKNYDDLSTRGLCLGTLQEKRLSEGSYYPKTKWGELLYKEVSLIKQNSRKIFMMFRKSPLIFSWSQLVPASSRTTLAKAQVVASTVWQPHVASIEPSGLLLHLKLLINNVSTYFYDV